MSDQACIFCKIIEGVIPSPHLATNDEAIAIADISPVAPTHYLILPRRHEENAVALHRSNPARLGALFTLVDELTSREGIADYRLVFNTGAGAGQSVFHAHLHLIAGRAFSWPPG
ncbi:MAG: HIT domain-containing protein [Actinomycetota bacterium]